MDTTKTNPMRNPRDTSAVKKRIDTVFARISKNQDLFIEAYKRKACNISLSCEAIKINRLAYYEWRRKYKDFDNRCREVEASLIDLAESQLLVNIKKGNIVALIFFLCNRAGDRWQNVNRGEQNGGLSGNIKVVVEVPVPREVSKTEIQKVGKLDIKQFSEGNKGV